MSTSIQSGSYELFVQKLKAQGLKTTSLSNGEANFADYFKALNPDIVKTLGGDNSVRNQVAQLFKSRNVISTDKLIAECKKLGINVKSEWRSDTKHLVDEKAGVGKGVMANGLTILTFEKDGKTFKVADANGNGALESEELMFNDMLSGISSDIGAMAGGATSGNGINAGFDIDNTTTTNPITVDNKLTETKKEEKTQETEENKTGMTKDQIKNLSYTYAWKNNITVDQAYNQLMKKYSSYITG